MTTSPAPNTPQTSTKATVAGLLSAIGALVMSFIVSWVAGKDGVNLNIQDILLSLAGAGALGGVVGSVVKAVANKPLVSTRH